VRIDGIDLRQLDPADVRRNIGCVGQDALLFYGTCARTSPSARPMPTTSHRRGGRDGRPAEFVNRHPQGFDMLIGERGESISGGQRQGVAMARAVLLDPPILLLDEPTSAMDFSSEEQLKERLRRFTEHKTLVIVTHRLSLIDLATASSSSTTGGSSPTGRATRWSRPCSRARSERRP
jgi:ATP-binding cassette subfamily C protein LapB